MLKPEAIERPLANAMEIITHAFKMYIYLLSDRRALLGANCRMSHYAKKNLILIPSGLLISGLRGYYVLPPVIFRDFFIIHRKAVPEECNIKQKLNEPGILFVSLNKQIFKRKSQFYRQFVPNSRPALRYYF